MDHPRPLPARGLAAVLLGLYLLVLAAAVWLPLPLDPPPMTNAPTYELHLARPDLTGWDFRRNVVMTVPFGVLLPLVVRWRYEAMVLACVALTLVAETGQYLGSVAAGWDWRAFDVNDLLANAVGGWVGLALTGGVLLARRRSRRGVPGPAELSRPHRWFGGAAAAAVVAWVLGATVSAGHTGAWSSGSDPCARQPGTAVTHLPDGASAWAGDDGWLCLSLDGSVATVPPTAPAGPMLSLESARGTVHLGVLRAGQASTVALPDGTRVAVHAVRVEGSPLRVWSVREPTAG